jgi:hypothetical protein
MFVSLVKKDFVKKIFNKQNMKDIKKNYVENSTIYFIVAFIKYAMH